MKKGNKEKVNSVNIIVCLNLKYTNTTLYDIQVYVYYLQSTTT